MSNNFKKVALSLATIFIWATAFVFTKLVDMPTFTIGTVRCLSAAIFLIIVSVVSGNRVPASKKDLALMLIAGASGFGIYMMFFNTGLLVLTSSTASIIVALTPVLTAYGATFLYGEKLTRIGYVTIVTAFLGVVIIMFWKGTVSFNFGVVWMLGCVVTFVIYNLITRKLQMDGYGSIEIVTFGMISGTLVQMPFTPHFVSEFLATDTTSKIIVLYLGIVVSGLSYVLWAKAFSYAEKTTEVTNFMFLTPFVSTVLGLIILREAPDLGTIIGGIVIIASVITFGLKGK